MKRIKRLSKGHYIYRGFKITCYEADAYQLSGWRRIWEAEDENGCGFAHSKSLSETKKLIDEELDK